MRNECAFFFFFQTHSSHDCTLLEESRVGILGFHEPNERAPSLFDGPSLVTVIIQRAFDSL